MENFVAICVDVALSRAFQVSVGAPPAAPDTTHLPRLRAELLHEGGAALLSTATLERALVARLEAPPAEARDTPFQYLLGCYRRADDEAVDYAVLALSPQTRGKFPQPDAALMRGPLQLLLDPPCCFPPGWLDAFVARVASGGDVAAAAFFEPVFEALPLHVAGANLLDSFQTPLALLNAVCASAPVARALAVHPAWLMDAQPLPSHAGRPLELTSVLGSFFAISALPHGGAGSNEVKLFATEHSELEILQMRGNLGVLARCVHDGLHSAVIAMLHHMGTPREATLAFLARLINVGAKRGELQFYSEARASNGTFVNLSAVMLRLCTPFIKAVPGDKQFGYITAAYFDAGRLALPSDELRLAATAAEAAAWSATAASAVAPAGWWHFECECFWLTTRALHLGFIKSFGVLSEILLKVASERRTLAELESQRAVWSAKPHAAVVELQLMEASNNAATLSNEAHALIAVLCEPVFLESALEFYRLVARWLLHSAGGGGTPLAPSIPPDFACLPEYLVKDAADALLSFLRYAPMLLTVQPENEFKALLMLFTDAPAHVCSPGLRAKCAEVLRLWMLTQPGTPSVSQVTHSAVATAPTDYGTDQDHQSDSNAAMDVVPGEGEDEVTSPAQDVADSGHVSGRPLQGGTLPGATMAAVAGPQTPGEVPTAAPLGDDHGAFVLCKPAADAEDFECRATLTLPASNGHPLLELAGKLRADFAQTLQLLFTPDGAEALYPRGTGPARVGTPYHLPERKLSYALALPLCHVDSWANEGSGSFALTLRTDRPGVQPPPGLALPAEVAARLSGLPAEAPAFPQTFGVAPVVRLSVDNTGSAKSKSPGEEGGAASRSAASRLEAALAAALMPNDFHAAYRMRKYLHTGEVVSAAAGSIWLAERRKDGVPVVVKVPLKRQNSLTLEAKMLRAVAGSPYVMECLDFLVLQEGGATREYLVLECMHGGSLVAHVMERERAGKPLRECETRGCVERMLRGLSALHKVIGPHGDFKPDNVLLANIGDVSSVKLANICDSRIGDFSSLYTTVLKGIYTPLYSAPERLNAVHGEGNTTAADVWSLGVTLYAMLTCNFPFGSISAPLQEIARAVVQDSWWPRSVTCSAARIDACSAECLDLLDAMLRKDPAQRITVAEALAHPWFTAEPQDAKPENMAFTVFSGAAVTLHASCRTGSATLDLPASSVAEGTYLCLIVREFSDELLATVGPLVTLLPHGMELLCDATLSIQLPPGESASSVALVRNMGSFGGIAEPGWLPCDPAATFLPSESGGSCVLRQTLRSFCHEVAARAILARLRLTIPQRMRRGVADDVLFDIKVFVDEKSHPDTVSAAQLLADARKDAAETGHKVLEYRCQLPVGTTHELSLVSRQPELLPTETVSLQPSPVPPLDSADQPLYETTIAVSPAWADVPEEDAVVSLGVTLLHVDDAGVTLRKINLASFGLLLEGTTLTASESLQTEYVASPPSPLQPVSHLPSSRFPDVEWDVMLSYRVPETGARGGDNYTLKLREALVQAGYTVYVCEFEIRVGDDWIDSVNTATTHCRAFVPICSETYGDNIASPYCYQEMCLANRQWCETKKKPLIFPVWHSGRYPHEALKIFLNNVQYTPAGPRCVKELRAAGDPDNTAADIIQALEKHGVPRSARSGGQDM